MSSNGKRLLTVTGVTAAFGLLTIQARADAGADAILGLNTLWVLIAGCLVFFMNTGFGMLETGFTRAKNSVNILSKNFLVFALASLAFYIIGWGLMFGDWGQLFNEGKEGLFMLSGMDNSPAGDDTYQGVYNSIAWATIPLEAKFFFQLAFAATAATIVSGAVAERIKYVSFVVFAFVLVAVMYPVTGHWVWGGGWLSGLGFHDFAGSTVVHSVGAWAALAGVLVLGPRKGKYLPNGEIRPVAPHNIPAAFLGSMILWLGWFGFNPGSQMAIAGSNAADVAHLFITTNSSAVMGILSATALSWIVDGKPDIGMSINGCLAGLVGITAGCYEMSIGGAMLTGLIAGILVVLSIKFFDRVKIDDPVGAISVHGVCGVWGTLAVGLFAQNGLKGLFYDGGATQLLAQVKGIFVVFLFTFVISLVIWTAIKAMIGLRVTEQEEEEGLDIGEHGQGAYNGFKMQAE